ncbi:hypothetical protein IFM51744_01412 [Aspergillus udagawae]|nr:hypothetical protein IFM51744_01412 [Aspergillus udagawae]
MSVSFPNIKADLSFSGGWIAFWLWACIFTVAMGWSPVMVARYRQKTITNGTHCAGCVCVPKGASSCRRISAWLSRWLPWAFGRPSAGSGSAPAPSSGPPASHQHGTSSSPATGRTSSSPPTGGTSSSPAPTRGRQPYKRMDVECPTPASYLDAIRPMDSAVSSELDRIRAAAQQAQADGWEKMILTLCSRLTQAWAAADPHELTRTS